MQNELNKITTLSKSISEKADLIAIEITKASSKVTECAVVAVPEVNHFTFSITIFILACFIGYYVVWKVTPALHTPLMSVTNAISGIIIVGAMIAAGNQIFGASQLIGFVAVMLASINIFGGFIVTNRMLQMFKKKK
jgi:NAD(P) transhydrogenase subunit alpha